MIDDETDERDYTAADEGMHWSDNEQSENDEDL